MYTCDVCKGKNVEVEYSFMININELPEQLVLNFDELEANDFFYCDDCKDECHPEEIESETDKEE